MGFELSSHFTGIRCELMGYVTNVETIGPVVYPKMGTFQLGLSLQLTVCTSTICQNSGSDHFGGGVPFWRIIVLFTCWVRIFVGWILLVWESIEMLFRISVGLPRCMTSVVAPLTNEVLNGGMLMEYLGFGLGLGSCRVGKGHNRYECLGFVIIYIYTYIYIYIYIHIYIYTYIYIYYIV